MRNPPPVPATSTLHGKRTGISRGLRRLLTGRGKLPAIVTHDTIFFLDPDLRRRTHSSHITLFTLACFLTLPAFAVFFVLAMALDSGLGSMTLQQGVMLGSAVLSSSLGVISWAALGLLLTKSADPKWHTSVWRLVITFAGVTLPSTLLWMFTSPGAEISVLILFPVFVIAASALSYGCRNLKMARHSLRRQHQRQLAMAA